MKVEVLNFGILKKADIELKGLTVIAGENDCGKSTIGKILFTLIHTLQNYTANFEKEKVKTILGLVDQINFLLSDTK